MKHRPTRPPTFRFRAPRPDDLDALMAIEEASFHTDRLSRRRMQHWIGASNRVFLVCDAGAAGIAGYLLIFFRRNSRHARLYSIALANSFRGFGIATQLLRRAEQLVHRQQRGMIYLEVRPDNKAAITLYESLGYVQFGEYQSFYEDGSRALRFHKRLASVRMPSSQRKRTPCKP